MTFDAPAGTPGLPDFRRDSHVGGLTPSLTYDTRDNIFTPLRGTFAEAIVGVFSQALGGDDEFQRVQLIAMHFTPLLPTLYLGLRGDGAASFGDAPFYLRPFISLRGVPIMRYQGDEIAQIDTELRWQFWRRFSLVGFVGLRPPLVLRQRGAPHRGVADGSARIFAKSSSSSGPRKRTSPGAGH